MSSSHQTKTTASGGHAEDLLPTAIFVQFGEIKVAAVLSTSCACSLMAERMYEEIRLKCGKCIVSAVEDQAKDMFVDACGGFEGVQRMVECEMRIEGESARVRKMYVVDELMTDVVLGLDFIREVNGSFNFGVGAFKWYANGKINISNFVADPKSIKCRREDVDWMFNADDSDEDSSDETESDVSVCMVVYCIRIFFSLGMCAVQSVLW